MIPLPPLLKTAVPWLIWYHPIFVRDVSYHKDPSTHSLPIMGRQVMGHVLRWVVEYNTSKLFVNVKIWKLGIMLPIFQYTRDTSRLEPAPYLYNSSLPAIFFYPPTKFSHHHYQNCHHYIPLLWGSLHKKRHGVRWDKFQIYTHFLFHYLK